MIKPKFITFTGIDERTDPYRVKDLSARYPVEWGILFSKRNQGHVARYPSMVEVGRFLDRFHGAADVKFSAHICGAYSNQIMSKRADASEDMPMDLPDLAASIGGLFNRTQINVADGETLVHNVDVRPYLAAQWANIIGADRAIIQCRGDFPPNSEVDWLFDRSGGAGRLFTNLAANAALSPAFCGYAGGIGPETIISVLDAIEKVHPADKPFWIDMEGNIRTNDWLDLDKCEAVLRAVYG